MRAVTPKEREIYEAVAKRMGIAVEQVVRAFLGVDGVDPEIMQRLFPNFRTSDDPVPVVEVRVEWDDNKNAFVESAPDPLAQAFPFAKVNDPPTLTGSPQETEPRG